MNWQITGIIISLITVFLSVIAHSITMAWWASRINTTVEKLNEMILSQKDEFKKRDELLAKMWDKHDALKDRVTILESK
jgi:cell division protein FtsL